MLLGNVLRIGPGQTSPPTPSSKKDRHARDPAKLLKQNHYETISREYTEFESLSTPSSLSHAVKQSTYGGM